MSPIAKATPRRWELLLVEDNPADIRLTQEVLSDTGLSHVLHIARDGEEALAMIRRQGAHVDLPEPDLVLLDLNLPRKDGRDVLAEVKGDPRLCHIPVIILSTSKAERDISICYRLHANCYLQKPVDLDAFAELMRGIEEFWFKRATLPPRSVEEGADDA